MHCRTDESDRAGAHAAIASRLASPRRAAQAVDAWTCCLPKRHVLPAEAPPRSRSTRCPPWSPPPAGQVGRLLRHEGACGSRCQCQWPAPPAACGQGGWEDAVAAAGTVCQRQLVPLERRRRRPCRLPPPSLQVEEVHPRSACRCTQTAHVWRRCHLCASRPRHACRSSLQVAARAGRATTNPALQIASSSMLQSPCGLT